jgi:ATP-dependent DNA helicase RecG
MSSCIAPESSARGFAGRWSGRTAFPRWSVGTRRQEARLVALAAAVQGKPKVPKPLMEETILALCADDWLSLRTLARLLNREPDSLRNHYINAMLQDGRLQARVPGKRTHPDQAYRRRG